jgi:hypothetical protein
MYFCGHTHSYSRSLPVKNGVVDQQPRTDRYDSASGTTLIVVGGAGCDEMNDELQANLSLAQVKEASAPYVAPTPCCSMRT